MPTLLSKQGDLEVVENGRQPSRTLQMLFTEEFQLANSAAVDRQIGLPVEPRGIDDPVWLLRMLMKRHRPFARESLPPAAGNIAWNAHADRAIPCQIQEPKRLVDPDFGIASIIQFALGDRDLADDAIAFVPEHGLQKTDF